MVSLLFRFNHFRGINAFFGFFSKTSVQWIGMFVSVFVILVEQHPSAAAGLDYPDNIKLTHSPPAIFWFFTNFQMSTFCNSNSTPIFIKIQYF
jgi:hypothetical protein